MHAGKTSATEHGPSRASWRIVALLMASVATSHFNRIAMSVAGTERIMPEYAIDEKTMGWVYSSYLLVYTLCMIPGGWFVDRCGARMALSTVGFGSAVLVAVTGLSGLACASAGPLIVALLLIRGSLGAVTAPLHPGCGHAIAFWMPREWRATANGLVVGSALVGIAATYWLFGSLIDAVGWTNAFCVTAGLSLLLAVAWAAGTAQQPAARGSVIGAEQGTTEPKPLSAGGSEPEAWPARTTASLAALTFSYATVSYVGYLFFYWIEHYYKTVLNLGNETARLNSTLLTVAMGAGIMAGGWLCDRCIHRFGRRIGTALIPLLGTVVCSLGLLGGVFSGDRFMSLACFMLALAAIGATESPFWTCAIDLGRGRPGKTGAIMNTGGNAGGLLAPVVTPLFSAAFGWQSGLALAAGICFLGAVPWLWIGAAAGPGGESGSGQP